MKRLLLAAAALAAGSLAPAHAGGPGACFDRDLRGHVSFQGGTGAVEGGVVLRKISARSCLLGGRASVAFAAGGQQLEVHVVGGRATDGRTRARTVALAQGQRAFVHVRWSNWCGKPYARVNVRLWLMSVEPRVRVRGTISPPRCDDANAVSKVAVGPYQRVR